jgi:hypothetical protein
MSRKEAMVRNCKHGFNPMDGPGLWCTACEAEEQDRKQRRSWPWKARFVYFFRRRR